MALQATVQVGFEVGTGDGTLASGPQYRLVAEPGVPATPYYMALRLYPATPSGVSARFSATYGRAEGGSRRVEQIDELVVFSGTNEASTEYRIDEIVSAKLIGDAVSTTGGTFFVAANVEAALTRRGDYTVGLNTPMYAVIRLRYKTAYQEVSWFGDSLTCGSSIDAETTSCDYAAYVERWNHMRLYHHYTAPLLSEAEYCGDSDSTTRLDGYIFDEDNIPIDRVLVIAFITGSEPAIYDFEPECGFIESEVVRVFSKYVVTEDGPFELPADYPTGTWGGLIDPDGPFVAIMCRTHAVGKVTKYKPWLLESFDSSRAWHTPKTGEAFWRPAYYYQRSTPTDALLASIHDSLDWDRILSQLERQFPGIVEGTP